MRKWLPADVPGPKGAIDAQVRCNEGSIRMEPGGHAIRAGQRGALEGKEVKTMFEDTSAPLESRPAAEIEYFDGDGRVRCMRCGKTELRSAEFKVAAFWKLPRLKKSDAVGRKAVSGTLIYAAKNDRRDRERVQQMGEKYHCALKGSWTGYGVTAYPVCEWREDFTEVKADCVFGNIAKRF